MHYVRVSSYAFFVLVVLVSLTFFSCEEEETGFGTVIIHTVLDTGGNAAGVQTYLVSEDEEERKSTDQNGIATYERVPAGSWDAGYFEDTTYRFASGQTTRKTIDVTHEQTTEVQLVVGRR